MIIINTSFIAGIQKFHTNLCMDYTTTFQLLQLFCSKTYQLSGLLPVLISDYAIGSTTTNLTSIWSAISFYYSAFSSVNFIYNNLSMWLFIMTSFICIHTFMHYKTDTNRHTKTRKTGYGSKKRTYGGCSRYYAKSRHGVKIGIKRSRPTPSILHHLQNRVNINETSTCYTTTTNSISRFCCDSDS